ncbi:hypothetical protein MPSEU_000456900 [Mayamaea pseudoterrestris]|nr:hypothetical protein MPSEU_000456900 [Mayamaea pseudoterrestris]
MQDVKAKPKSSIASRWNPTGNSNSNDAAAASSETRSSRRQGSWLSKKKAANTGKDSTGTADTTPFDSEAAASPRRSGKQLSWRKKKSDRDMASTPTSPMKKALSWRKKKEAADEVSALQLAQTEHELKVETNQGNTTSEEVKLQKTDGKRLSPRKSWKAATGKLSNMTGLKKAPVLDAAAKKDFGVGRVDKPDVAKSAQAKAMVQLREPQDVLLEAVQKRLQDSSKLPQAKTLVARIKAANGFPQRRRPSIRDNDIVSSMEKVIANDPSVTEIKIKADPRVAHLKRSQLLSFCDGLRTNLYLKKLVMTQAELDNEFLSSLSASLETNFTLEHIDLSNNAFTSDALVEFCQAMAENKSIRTVELKGQHSPVMGTAEEDVLDAISKNYTIQRLKLDFKNKQIKKEVAAIVDRNAAPGKSMGNMDATIMAFLEREATRAEEHFEHVRQEREIENITDDHDWEYLFELNELAKKYKHYDLGVASDDGDSNKPTNFASPSPKKNSVGAMNVKYTADNLFLTPEFISSFLVDDDEGRGLTFAFQAQVKLFKRFPIGDADRRKISEMFADALLDHPRSKELTHINVANSGCGDEWLIRLCERSLKDPRLLPKLSAINLETNYFTEAGIVALSKCMASKAAWKYLQSVKLENQRHLVSSRAEFALAKSMCVNRSIITMSLRVRNLWERDQINKFVVRNIDFLRQARMKNAVKLGTRVERSRNKIEEFFDKIAANDSSITEVDLVGDQLFTALPQEERLQAARSFANNTHVKTIRMCQLGLDDAFGVAMAKSIDANSCVEKINFESNKIASEGIPALVAALGRSKSIVEMQLRHQFKPMDSTAEDSLPALFNANVSCVKLGLDLRSLLAQSTIEKKLMANREIARKARLVDNAGKATTPPRLKTAGKMQSWFQQIAANDSSITEVDLVGDKLFLAMRQNDRLDAAASFATNTHIKSVKMTMLELDDAFAVALATSLTKNKSIEKLILEQNDIRGDGIKAICKALASNKTVVECQLRHQKKPMDTAAEETLAGLMGDNETVVKLGLVLRSSRATLEVESKLKKNRELQRKAKLAAK